MNSLKRYRYGKKSEKVKKEKVEPDNRQETQEASPDANTGIEVGHGISAHAGVERQTAEYYRTADHPRGFESTLAYGYTGGASSAKLVNTHGGQATLDPATARPESMVPGAGDDQFVARGCGGAGCTPPK